MQILCVYATKPQKASCLVQAKYKSERTTRATITQAFSLHSEQQLTLTHVNQLVLLFLA